jgi:transposase-like protein
LVADVTKHLGVSAQSLYKWVKLTQLTGEGKNKTELLKVKREKYQARVRASCVTVTTVVHAENFAAAIKMLRVLFGAGQVIGSPTKI